MLLAREVVFEAIRQRAILRDTNQRLISPNGVNNTWLIDLRRVFMDPHSLDAVAELFWQKLSTKLPFQVGGMETASIPLISAILMKFLAKGTPVTGFIIRKERKTYGTGSTIEGEISDLPIVLVDDIINSGNSLEKARAVLDQLGRKISSVYAVIDYQSRAGIEWRARHRLPVLSSFGLNDFELSLGERKQASIVSPIFKFKWRFSSPDPNFFHRVPKSFPVTDGDRIYFGSDCGIFWCLDAWTGAIVWWFKVDTTGHKNLWSAPALHQGRVFFGSYDGNVYCLDSATGAEIWRYIGADWVGSSPALAPDIGLLFVGLEFAVEGRRGSVVALDINTGEKRWEHFTKRYTHASPASWPEKQLVACGSNDDEIFLFEGQTGRMLWRFQTRAERGKGSIRHAPAFDKKRNHLVTGCADGRIYIIDVATGKEVWSVQTANTIYTVPLVFGDTAYVGSTDKYLYILDLEKQLVRKKIYFGSKIFAPSQLLQGKIYSAACSGTIYEIDPMTDEVLGTHQLADAITNTLTFSAKTNLFYVLTYVNEMYALERL